MWLPFIVFVYLGVHVGAYAYGLRRRTDFRQERTIFLYHLYSWILSVAVFGTLELMRHGGAGAAVSMVLTGSMHGIYSLSFLELWSLSQGSYSLSILTKIETDPLLQSLAPDATSLAEIGRQKRAARLLSLQQRGLLNADGSLTRPGAAGATVIAGIIWLSNGRNLNH